MKNLFLGIGRVSTSMARTLPGICTGLDEKEGSVYRFEWENHGWVKKHSYPGGFDEFDFDEVEFDRVVISPGIDPRRPFFGRVKGREVRELDLFCESFKGRTIVVTGTNGKSTVTYQIGSLLRRCLGNEKVFVGGNLEPASFDLFQNKTQYEWAVLEVSSFQAERLRSAQFDFGILLNLGQDHADRYESQSDYHEAKWNLLKHSKNAIYPGEYAFEEPSILPEFSQKTPYVSLYQDFFQYLEKESRSEGQKFRIDISESKLPRLPHRLEEIRGDQQVLWINDSKATNVDSSLYALRAYAHRAPEMTLLLGGRDKGDNFQRLQNALMPLKRVIVFGEAREKIASQLTGVSQLVFCESLKTACHSLLDLLEENEVVLLSPGCSSFDEFLNYEDRGNFFRSFAQSARLS